MRRRDLFNLDLTKKRTAGLQWPNRNYIFFILKISVRYAPVGFFYKLKLHENNLLHHSPEKWKKNCIYKIRCTCYRESDSWENNLLLTFICFLIDYHCSRLSFLFLFTFSIIILFTLFSLPNIISLKRLSFPRGYQYPQSQLPFAWFFLLFR